MSPKTNLHNFKIGIIGGEKYRWHLTDILKLATNNTFLSNNGGTMMLYVSNECSDEPLLIDEKTKYKKIKKKGDMV